jgi:iron complex outermembrane receptor protein
MPVIAGAQTSVSLPVEDIKSEVKAEGASSTEAEKKQRDDAERIQVTGSHIKRIDVEGASPVQTLTRKELEKTGYNSVSDVLRDTAANSFGSTREDSGSNAAGVAHVNLRGLGSSNTLVLLNGQRLPSDAVTGAVDLNLIPMAAVERVEILKDGASAIYGSDALGGVVNIITRKDFSGNEVAFTTTQPELEGGRRQDISLVNGINKGKLSMVNVLQYRQNETVFSRDREWTSSGRSTFGAHPAYRSAGVDGAKWQVDGNCPTGDVQQTPGGDFCTFKYSDYSTELPALEQTSFLSESNYDLSSRVRVKARVGGTQKKAEWSFAPAPDVFTIPAAVAATLGPGGTPLPGTDPTKELQVRYRVTELGTRDTKVESNSYNMLLGSTIQLSEGWEMEASASHNRVMTRDEGVNGYALTKDLQEAIATGAFNPFAPPGERGSIERTRYRPLEEMTSELSSAEAKVSGDVGTINGAPIIMALGTTFTFQKYEDRFDEKSVAGEVFGNAGSSGGGQRDTKAVFTEFSLPVAEKLELQLAGRYDRYSDFGDTFNPKIAALYRPNTKVLVRASAGTGFKAPLMQDLYAATSDGNPTFIDAQACAQERAAGGPTPACTPQQYNVVSGGNKGLKEEKSISFNLGTVVQPTRDWSFGTDLFLTKLNNVVGIDYGDAMEAERDLGAAYLASKGVMVHRDSNGYIDHIEAPMQNLAAQEITGIDLSASYRIRKVKLGMEHSQLFYFKEEGFPGTGMKDKLGENGKPPWRNVASIVYMPTERHTLTFDGVTTAGHEKAVEEAGNLRNYTTVDLQYAYNNKKIGVITAGIKNVMGTVPPIDDSNPNQPLDITLYDQIGRQFYTGYKATF